MSQSGLLVEFSLLERQPTDPPDVPSLDTSLATLSELLQQGNLVVSELATYCSCVCVR